MSNRSWLLAALAASVVVNLVLGGYLLGRMSAGRPPAMGDPMLSGLHMVRALPEARRDELRPLLRTSFRDMRPQMRRMWRAQRRIDAALTAEPFAATELDEALAEFRDALLATQQRSHQAMVELATVLTPAERLLLRHALETRSPRRHHRDGGRGEVGRQDDGPRSGDGLPR
jgi:uncharacterized membrane protein